MTITHKFRSVGWVAAVSAAALSFYLISYRVSAERGALEDVETDIAQARDDILTLNTEFETRARMSQIERWNRRDFVLAAPTPGQVLDGEFELASLLDGRPMPDSRPIRLASAGDIESAPQGREGRGFAKPDVELVQADLQLAQADAAEVPHVRPATYLVPAALERRAQAEQVDFMDDRVRGEIAFRALGEKATGGATD